MRLSRMLGLPVLLLAGALKAFIGSMIPHHESAIAMAQVALEKSKNPEIKDIAGDIVPPRSGRSKR